MSSPCRLSGLLLVLMLLCSNVLLAEAQRGKLTTSARPKGGLRSNSAENTSTNKTSAISVSSAGDKEKVVENEKDVLATKPIAISPIKEAPATVQPAKDETDHVRNSVEKPKDGDTKDVDTKVLDNEKSPTKRDLPFVIQSSAGLPLTENLLRGFTPIHERFEESSFDLDSRSQRLLQRSDTEFNSNTPQVFISKPQHQQQSQHQPSAFSSPHPHSSYHQQPQQQQQQASVQHLQSVSYNPYTHHLTNQAYQPSPGNGGSASASQHSFQTPYNHHSIHENALKFTYNPYSTSPHVSTIYSAAPSNKFATLAQLQSPYLNYGSAAHQHLTGAFATSYPTISGSSYGIPGAASAVSPSGQYIGYATTVQPQLVHYQASAATNTANGQAAATALQQQNHILLGRIPHNQAITDFNSYYNPNIIHAHNQNLYASNFAKVANPSSTFNQANGQSLFQLSPYAYPVQAAFQVGSGGVASGSVNAKPYSLNHFQQGGTPATASVALTGSSPTLATPQYKHYSGAALSAAAAYNINKNEVSNHLGYSTSGPTIATIKINPYGPQSFNHQHGNPQTATIAFAYAKPISSYGQFQQQVAQQQSPLHASTYAYTSPTYQQATQVFPQAASSNQQPQSAYFVNAQSFYGSPNKYQSAYAQIGGTPQKLLYASH